MINLFKPLFPIFKEANNRDIYLLAADRTGIENNVDLLGCSCIVKLGSSLQIIEYLDKNSNGIIYKKLKF